MKLRDSLSRYWKVFQTNLFLEAEEKLGPLSGKLVEVVRTLEIVRIESHVSYTHGGYVGRPTDDRRALARAFVAKAVLGLTTTRMLLDRLDAEITLRRVCGWERKSEVPSEATFSRAFGEFAEEGLSAKVHKALICEMLPDRVAGHISRDATAIEAREKPAKKEKPKTSPFSASSRKRGRPKHGEARPQTEPRRLERQSGMSLPEMLGDLPKACDVGTKRNSQGHQESWQGYKLHIDTADGDIPISAILTSASVHDSQVAIPLAAMTSERIDNCYDLMDSAYDCKEITNYIRKLGHIPIVDSNPRRDKELQGQQKLEATARKTLNFIYPEDVRYRERSAAERVNSSLKDNYGARTVRVRGHEKVFCHLMFGVLALAAQQILRLSLP